MDAVDSDGATALMIAAYRGKAEIARLLLEAGADATLRATSGHRKGKTALRLAEQKAMAEEKGGAEVAALLRG